MRPDAESERRLDKLLAVCTDWDSLLLTASYHDSLGALQRAVSRRSAKENEHLVPDGARETLSDCARRVAQRNLYLSNELKRIQEELHAHGIEAVAFDGPVLAAAYSDPSVREVKNLSLLVRTDQILRARQLLLEKGYRREYTWDTARERAEVRYLRVLGFERAEDAVHVWLFTAIDPGGFSPELDLGRLDAGLVNSAHPGAATLSPADQLLHAAVLLNHWAWSPRLWMVADFARLVDANPGLDWDALMSRARRFGANRRLLAAFQVSHRLLKTELPAVVGNALRADSTAIEVAEGIASVLAGGRHSRSGASGRTHLALRSRERPMDRARWVARLVLGPTRQDWSLVALPAPLYPAVKPFRMVARRLGMLPKRRLAVFMPTPMPVAEAMLALSEVQPGDTVYDLGCGDGRIVILAAQRYGAKGVGVDLDSDRVEEAKANALQAGVDQLVNFMQRDVGEIDLSSAKVVCMFLSPEANLILRPKLQRELPVGARIVSRSHDMGDWPALRTKLVASDGSLSRIYLWKIEARKDRSQERLSAAKQ